MQFALLFIGAFLIGVLIYYFSRQWIYAVVIPMVLFTLNAVLDSTGGTGLIFTLVFGLTIVFFASLLGAYVVQVRTIEPELPEDDEQGDGASEAD